MGIFNGIKGRLAMMVFIPIALFVLFSLLYTIPNIKNDLMNEKQVQTKDMVDISLSLLDHYYAKQVSGELSREEAQRLASESIKALRFGEGLQDYYWINDFHPRIIMHPFRPDLEGQDVSGVKDKEGLALFVEFVNVARKDGAGYVPYYWQYYSDANRTEPKLSYVATFEPWQWIIGTGVYITDVNEIAAEKRNVTVILVGIITIISLLICMILAERLIVKPVTIVSKIGQKMASGDFTCNVPEQILRSKNEIGQLGNVFLNIKSNMTDILGKVKKTAEHVSNASVELASSAEETTQATNNMSIAIQTVADGTENQVTNSTENSRAMEEMAYGIGRVAESSTSIADSAGDMIAKSNVGQDSVKKAIEKITDIERDTQATSTVIETLNKDSEQIGNFIKIIEEISQQTNLLALNAAIEAARAGEAGRGFAVVADEIRKLADQTSKSTQEIHNLVSNIRSNTSHAVQAMNMNQEKVKEGMHVITSLDKVFYDIIHAVQDIGKEIQEMAAVAEEMSAGSEEVSASTAELTTIAKEASLSIQNIAAIAEEQLAAMEEISSSSQVLSDMAEDLSDLTTRFKV